MRRTFFIAKISGIVALVLGAALALGSFIEVLVEKGYPAKSGSAQSYPWLVSIQVRDSNGSWHHLCGGVVLGPRTVLTTAHCNVVPAYDLGVILDPVNAHAPGQPTSRVASFISHEKFQLGKRADDIAIVTLESDLPNTVPVKLEEAGVDELRQLTGLGWGLDKQGKTPKVLMAYKTPQEKNLKASAAFSDFDGDSMLATGPNGATACGGDSGGPLIVESDPCVPGVLAACTPPTVAALIGAGWCGDRGYHVHTRISRYKSWIADNKE